MNQTYDSYKILRCYNDTPFPVPDIYNANVCQNGGKITYTCECPRGYKGKHCESGEQQL